MLHAPGHTGPVLASINGRCPQVRPQPLLIPPHLSFRSPERSSFAACIKKGAPHHDLVRKEPGRLFSPADVFNTTIRNTSTSQRTQPCGQTGTGFASVFSNRRGPDSAGGRPGGTAQQSCRGRSEATIAANGGRRAERTKKGPGHASQPLYIVARLEGFEPPTLGFEVRCSIQLSYRRGMDRGDQARSARSVYPSLRPRSSAIGRLG